ncbi:MAG: TIGR02449 family protein [Candidatus Competibacterales bacterium]|nr:TIGR02449 family protein [Candidatus Competibacterales bacterium]
MNNPLSAETGQELAALEQRIVELIGRCEQLAETNRELRARYAAASEECAALRSQNEQARTRIDAMVARLKNLEAT